MLSFWGGIDKGSGGRVCRNRTVTERMKISTLVSNLKWIEGKMSKSIRTMADKMSDDCNAKPDHQRHLKHDAL